MPYNLSPATVAPGTVLPQSLNTSFVETHVYPLLSVQYNDGTFERSLIQDFANPPRALRTWALVKRLTTKQLTDLLHFFEVAVQGGLLPFYFYNPIDVLPGQHIGSNYDPTGDNTQGRAVCFFRGNWAQKTELGGPQRPAGDPLRDIDGRHIVPSLMLVECWDAQQTGGG